MSRRDLSSVIEQIDSVKEQIRIVLEEVGTEADALDVERGTYHNVTGRLRASNKHEVTDDLTLRLYNDAPYAADVEARGEEVRTNGILYAQEEVKRRLQ